jgi:hypothetical protein
MPLGCDTATAGSTSQIDTAALVTGPGEMRAAGALPASSMVPHT